MVQGCEGVMWAGPEVIPGWAEVGQEEQGSLLFL